MDEIPMPIPTPEVLNPDRLLMPERDDLTLEDHRTRAQAAVDALQSTCDYGKALRQQLETARTYLAAHVPADAADDAAWTAWGDVYSDITSILAGPHGDSGFGEEEAKLIAQKYRNG